MKPSPAPAPSPPTTSREWLLAGTLLAGGVLLRIWLASRSAVEHFDEGVYASNLLFNEPPYHYPMRPLYAPPLLPTLIEGGMIAGLPSNLAAILPSLLAGCLTLVVVWRLGRRWFGPAAGVAALALAALSDFHLVYSATALTDVLLTLFVLLAVAATARAVAWCLQSDGSGGLLAPPGPAKEDIAKALKAGAAKRRGKRAAEVHAAASLPVSGRGGNLVETWAVIAGLLTAAAWWTKYNGWLPLAIALAGTAGLMIVSPAARENWRRLALVVALIAAVAAIGWSPAPFGLGDVGGYSAVSANHAKYVVGPAGWLDSALRQIANQSAMEGALSWGSLAVALIAAWCLLASPSVPSAASSEPSKTATSAGPLHFLIGGIAILTPAAAVESTFVVLVVVALGSVLAYLIDFLRRPREQRQLDESSIGMALLTAWLFGLLLATPNYWPYPRLVTPLLASLWLTAGYGIARLLRGRATQPANAAEPQPISTRRFATALCVGLLAMLPVVYFGRAPLSSAGGSLSVDRTSMSQAAEEIARRITADLGPNKDASLSVVYVQAEPALLFQLREAGLPNVHPVSTPPNSAATVEGEPIPTYYVFGPHAERDQSFAAAWPERKSDFAEVEGGPIEVRPSPVVWLDSHDPRQSGLGSERYTLVRRK